MSEPTGNGASDTVSLSETVSALIADLGRHRRGRTAHAVVSGDLLRAVVIALREGAELAEHEAPPAATLHVLEGRVSLRAGDREWPLEAGQLVTIPQERHSVHAHTDAAFLLTVALHGRD